MASTKRTSSGSEPIPHWVYKHGAVKHTPSHQVALWKHSIVTHLTLIPQQLSDLRAFSITLFRETSLSITYVSPVGELIESHGVSYHQFAMTRSCSSAWTVPTLRRPSTDSPAARLQSACGSCRTVCSSTPTSPRSSSLAPLLSSGHPPTSLPSTSPAVRCMSHRNSSRLA